MALTPEDIVNKRFQSTKFREGYDQDEVDDFLDEVVVEMRRVALFNRAPRCRADRGLGSFRSAPRRSTGTACTAPALGLARSWRFRQRSQNGVQHVRLRRRRRSGPRLLGCRRGLGCAVVHGALDGAASNLSDGVACILGDLVGLNTGGGVRRSFFTPR